MILLLIILIQTNKLQMNYGLFLYDPIYPTPPLGQDMTQGQFSKRSLTDLNSEFSFS